MRKLMRDWQRELAACNTLANLGAVLRQPSTPPTQLPEARGNIINSSYWGQPPTPPTRRREQPKQATKTTACGSASGMAPPRIGSPSRTGGKAGPSCPPLHNVETSSGARTAASSIRSITRPRNSGRVYREIHVRGKSQTLALSLNIPRSTPGRRRGLSARSTLVK